MEKTLVIMAAGMGSRYGGLKQLDIIGPSGETIMDYSVHDALRAGFSKVVFILRKEIEQEFQDKVVSRFSHAVDVRCVLQSLDDLPEGFSVPEGRTKPWGTGHAMLSARKEVKEPFLIINADDFYGADSFRQAASYLDRISPDELLGALVGFSLKNTLSENGSVARGICQADGKGLLLDVEEVLEIQRKADGFISAKNRAALSPEDLVSMNMWAFSPGIFSYTEECFYNFLKAKGQEEKSEFFIPLVVNSMIHEKGAPVTVLETSARWFGVTYKEDKPAVMDALKKLIDEKVYPESLWGRTGEAAR